MFTIAKESIHSGHFMVSHFEAEEQDDEYELAVPVPESEVGELPDPYRDARESKSVISKHNSSTQPLPIDTSLSKLFQCMTIAYRQKLTSPKWNRFRGIRLRWKDKIRLNNVIWRCWHMQFIKKKNTYICQFASPLDVDTHNKPEAIVLEGKYWKRKLAAVTAEYKKWRMYFRNHILGHVKDNSDPLNDLDCLTWNSPSSESMHMMIDEDYLGMMSDTLFSTISSQNFVFPDSREIAKAGGLADFIQPSLGPLQPSLDDYMDTYEPLQELLSIKLPPVPEENGPETMYKHGQHNWCYTDLDLMNTNLQVSTMPNNSTVMNQYNPVTTSNIIEKPLTNTVPETQISNYPNDMPMIHPVEIYLPQQVSQQSHPQTSIYQLPPISKSSKLLSKRNQTQIAVTTSSYVKQETSYHNYNLPDINPVVRLPICQQTFKASQVCNEVQTQQVSQGYKFPAPSLNPSNLKFTSQTSYKAPSRSRIQHVQSMEMKNTTLDTSQKDMKSEKSRHRINRPRSTSMNREPIKKPPLISAVSDPSLLTPSNSVLLTQLLTNSTQNNILSQTSNLGVKSESLNLIRVKEENLPMSIMSPSQISASSINTPSSSLNDQMLISTIGASNSSSPSSSQGIGSCPTSPQALLGSPSADKDHRRVGHIHAEQKRRYNIKNGFDMIHSLIPQLNQNPNAKLSKAAMLQKGAEYIRQLQQERSQLKEEMDSLKQQIDALNTSINNCQSLLSATGAPVSMKKDNEIQEMFDDYVKKRTMEDWKFWIFSLLFRPLLISFNNFVSTSSLEDLYRSTLHWVEQHCTLVDLRPSVLNSLIHLCTKTDVLAEPEKLPEQVMQAVAAQPNSSSSSGT